MIDSGKRINNLKRNFKCFFQFSGDCFFHRNIIAAVSFWYQFAFKQNTVCIDFYRNISRASCDIPHIEGNLYECPVSIYDFLSFKCILHFIFPFITYRYIVQEKSNQI